MTEKLCVQCHVRPIHIKKRGLCSLCYQQWYKEHGRVFTQNNEPKTRQIVEEIVHKAELEFVKNYFNHSNWLYQPAHFRANGMSYIPDFYDAEKNTFIELIGSRQGYHQRKEKVDWFQKTFPGLEIEVRTPDGELIKQWPSGDIHWPKPKERDYF